MTSTEAAKLASDPTVSPAARAAIVAALRQPSTAPALPHRPVDKSLEERFLLLWQELGGPELRREFAFAEPARKFRFDFAYLPKLIAIEIEGGTGNYGKSRHTSSMGFTNDLTKYNLATLMGYKVFRLNSRLLGQENILPIVVKCRGD